MIYYCLLLVPTNYTKYVEYNFILNITFIFRFGVCCVFMVTACGSTISQNCTYIKNPNFPNAYTDLTACVYTIKKCDCCK